MSQSVFPLSCEKSVHILGTAHEHRIIILIPHSSRMSQEANKWKALGDSEAFDKAVC